MKQTNRTYVDNNHHAPAPADDSLRQMFLGSQPVTEPVDVDRLIASHVLRRRGGSVGRLSVGVLLAAMLTGVCAAGGWYAGTTAAAQKSKQLSQELTHGLTEKISQKMADSVAESLDGALASNRGQVVRDVTHLLNQLQVALANADQDQAKQLAVMLRNDYQARIAVIEGELFELRRAVDKIGSLALTSTRVPNRSVDGGDSKTMMRLGD